jgi:hypothetical protein
VSEADNTSSPNSAANITPAANTTTATTATTINTATTAGANMTSPKTLATNDSSESVKHSGKLPRISDAVGGTLIHAGTPEKPLVVRALHTTYV